MAKRGYVRRYSQAVFELALEKNELDRWHTDLQKLAAAAENQGLAAAMGSRKFSFEDKMTVLAERLAGVSPLGLNLAGLLVVRGRFGMAGDILEDYRLLVDQHRGIEQAEVITAVALDDADKQALARRLSAVTGKKVALKTQVDAKLLGGVVARVGGKLLDGSTRSKLEALKTALARAG